MVRRTRDIQKKIWLTPQEERTIAKKMEMIGTENFGAYARKMLIDGYIIVVDYTEQKKARRRNQQDRREHQYRLPQDQLDGTILSGRH